MSRAIATTILRKFSACRSSFEVKLILRELGDAVDEEGDLAAELALDVVRGRERVLDDVVEEAGADAGRVERELGDDPGDGGGVDEVRVAALALLPFVRLLAVVVGARDYLDVRSRVICANPFD